MFPIMELPLGIDEMILARVPPEGLYNRCKHVCRRWRDIISGAEFARRNFLQAKSQKLLMGRGVKKLATKLLDIESCEGGGTCKIHNTGLWSSDLVRSSCNGLVIVHQEDTATADGTLQVVNLLTRACVTIPAPKTGCRHDYKEGGCAVGFGYDPVTGTYKVVHLYVFSLGFEVFTLNSCPKEEAWRSIPGPWSDDYNGKSVGWTFDYDASSIQTGSIIHWSNGTENYIVSIDVSDERNPFRTDFPVAVYGKGWDEAKNSTRFSLVDINGDLCFVHNVSSSVIDIYILDQNERIWSKKQSILRESRLMPKMCHLAPVCSLRNGQVLVLEPVRHSRCLYVYDMRQQVLKKVKMNNNKVIPCAYTPHTSSLLHWTHKV